jgi:hypothetical protein
VRVSLELEARSRTSTLNKPRKARRGEAVDHEISARGGKRASDPESNPGSSNP